jgi:hypothetical protein
MHQSTHWRNKGDKFVARVYTSRLLHASVLDSLLADYYTTNNHLPPMQSLTTWKIRQNLVAFELLSGCNHVVRT